MAIYLFLFNLFVCIFISLTANLLFPPNNKAYSNNFITDYQCDEAEVMLLRFYVFKPLEDRVDYFTYSPITNEFEEDDDSQSGFRLVQVDP